MPCPRGGHLLHLLSAFDSPKASRALTNEEHQPFGGRFPSLYTVLAHAMNNRAHEVN